MKNLLMIVVLFVIACSSALAGDAEVIDEIDRFMAERLDALLQPAMNQDGAEGGAIEIEVKETVKIPVYKAANAVFKIKPKIVLRKSKNSPVFELITMGDGTIAGEIGVERGEGGANVSTGAEGKLLISYTADPAQRGQLTRFLVLMVCGFNMQAEKLSEKVLDALPDALLDKVAKAAGFALRTAASAGAVVADAVGDTLDVLHLPGGGVADNVQLALDRFANRGEALTKFINALDSVPPLDRQLKRFKIGGGPMARVELSGGGAEGELEVNQAIGLERRYLPVEERATGITGLLLLKGKGAMGGTRYLAIDGDLGVEVKLLNPAGDKSNEAELVFSGSAKTLGGLKLPGFDGHVGTTGSAIYVLHVSDAKEGARTVAQWARAVVDHLTSAHSEQNLYEAFSTLADITSSHYLLAWGRTAKAKLDLKLIKVELNGAVLATRSDAGASSGDLFQHDN